MTLVMVPGEYYIFNITLHTFFIITFQISNAALSFCEKSLSEKYHDINPDPFIRTNKEIYTTFILCGMNCSTSIPWFYNKTF